MVPDTIRTTYRCPFCALRFPHVNDLTAHVSAAHTPTAPPRAHRRASGATGRARGATKVAAIMSAPAICVTRTATLAEIASLLLAHRIGGVPVIDDDGGLLGVVTEADLIAHQAYDEQRHHTLALVHAYLRGRDPAWVPAPHEPTAQDLMTPAPVHVHPDDDLSLALHRLVDGDHDRLPVVARGRVVGMVSHHDVLRALEHRALSREPDSQPHGRAPRAGETGRERLTAGPVQPMQERWTSAAARPASRRAGTGTASGI